MKRTIATLGVVGLGLLGATVSANAAPPGKITICHATGSATNPYIAETINVSALAAHVGDTEDIVPENEGNDMPNGQNLTPENIALLNNGCVAVVPVDPVDPVVDPVDPVVDPVDPVVDPVDPVDPVVDPVDPVVDPVDPVDPVVDQVAPVAPSVVAPPAAPVVVPVTPVVPPAATLAVPEAPVVTPATPIAQTGTGTAARNVGYNVQTAAGGNPGAGIPAWLTALTCLFAGVAAAVLWRSGVRSRNAHG